MQFYSIFLIHPKSFARSLRLFDYPLSLQLISQNGLIIIDNMLWHGDVANLEKQDTRTKTIRDLNLKIKKDNRVNYSLLPLSDGLSFIPTK